MPRKTKPPTTEKTNVDPSFAPPVTDPKDIVPSTLPGDVSTVAGGGNPTGTRGSGTGLGGRPTPLPAHRPPTPKPKPLTQAEASAKAIITDALRQYGLDGLANWAWSQYKQTNSTDLVMLELRDRPEYKSRFAGLLQLAQQGTAITETQQIEWERSAADIMRQAGLPKGFYDNWTDFQGMIGSGWSVSELSNRVNNAYSRVANAPASVRQYFNETYGTAGDSALASFFLDQKKALPVLQQQAAAGEIGGFLAQQGVHVSRSVAEAAARYGADTSTNLRNATEVGAEQAAGLFDASIAENPDVTAETGVQAAYGGDAAAAAQLQHRIQSRQARTTGSGGAIATGEGVIGLGTQRP